MISLYTGEMPYLLCGAPGGLHRVALSRKLHLDVQDTKQSLLTHFSGRKGRHKMGFFACEVAFT